MNIFELFKESYGVGVVASKKQAKDPRYSHSLTKDVRPDTPKKNAKALMLASKNLNEAPAGEAVPDENLTNILKLIAGLESNGRNIKNQTGSGAHGIYQFVPDTFELVKKGLDDNHPYKNASWDDFKENTDIQNSYASAGMMDNVRYLNNKKIPVNVETIYNAHHFGPFVASLMHKNPDRSLKDIYEQNKDIKGMPSWETIKKQNPYLDDDATGASTTAYHKQRASNPAMQKFYDDVGVDVASLYDQDEISLPNEAPVVATTPKAEEEPKQNVDAIATNPQVTRAKKVIPQTTKLRTTGTTTAPDPQTAKNVAQDATQSRLDKDGETPGDKAMAAQIEKEKAKDDAINAELGGADAAGATPTPASEYDDVKDAFGSEEDAALQDKQAEELSKTYAERGKESLNNDRLEKEEAELKRLQTELEYTGTEDAFGGERQSEEEVAAQKKELEREIDVKKRAIAFIKDPGITSDGGGSMTPEQLEFLKAKEKEELEIKQAKEEGRKPDPALIGNKSVGELELDAARAYRYGAQAEKEGKPEVAAAARKEGDANMKVRRDMVDLGVTWMSGAGNPDQAQRTIDDVKAGNTTGINMFQKPEGEEREQFQQNQAEADRQDAENEEGAWDRTSTLDDEKKKVDPTPLDKRPQAEPEEPKSTTAAKTSYSGSVASTGGATSKGGGYGQGAEVDATVSATPKVDPYPNPGYTGEELRIYNKLSDSQKAKIIRDHEKYKRNVANQMKTYNPRLGPPPRDPDSLKPRSLLDIVHQQQLTAIEGGTQLVDPAKWREVSKVLGMSNRTWEDKKKRDAALDAIRFKAPSMDELQKGMTPIVDKSINKDEPVKANVPPASRSNNTSAIGQAIDPTAGLTPFKGTLKTGEKLRNIDGKSFVVPAPQGNVLGTNLGNDNASQQARDLQKQKAEEEEKKAEQEAAAAEQKAKEEQQKAEQKAKQEARKAEDERRRQEQQAEQERRVSGSTQTVGAPVKVGESAIFRAIMRK